MLGDGRKRKKSKQEQNKGEMKDTHTTQATITPPPLSQLSDWVLFPLRKQITHFIPYTAYSTATTTICQTGISFCCHPFCLPTQAYDAFSLFLPSITTQTLKPTIMFLTQSPVPTLQLIIPGQPHISVPTQHETYNPSDPLAV